MSTPLSSDSELNLFRALGGSGEPAPEIPFFDLDSDDPLPDLLENGVEQLNLPDKLKPLGTNPVRELPTFDDLEESSPKGKISAESSCKPGALWLEGDVLMIACPDCSAPMAVRIWLMAADCWNCGISIELSEDQEREAQRLLAERDRRRQEQAAKVAARQAAAKPVPTKPSAPKKPAENAAPARKPSEPAGNGSKGDHPDKAETRPATRQPTGETRKPASEPSPLPTPSRREASPAASDSAVATAPAPPKSRPTPPAPAARKERAPIRKRTAAGRPSRVQAAVRKKATANSAQVWLSERIKETPAWLLSMIIHLVMLTLLGLLTFDDEDEGPYITISAAVSTNVREGEAVVEIDPNDELNFELPLTDRDRKDLTREALIKADQDARELQLDSNDVPMQLAPVDAVKSRLRNGSVATRALAARDPRLRVEVVKKEGGTTRTEAAVSRGLRWLASQQERDGRWRLDGGLRSDPAATSLALLPFLGAGQTHLVGKYQKTVSGGLSWLIKNQAENGDLSRGSAGHTRMYAHGQSAIVLCEAFAMTGDEELRVPAQKAIDFIIAAQHPAGGWRYNPGEAGDTSVLGWQVMALQSGRAANLSIESPIGIDVMANANNFLDSVSHRDGSLYGYVPGRQPTHIMTAEALLCRMYLGWNKSDPGLVRGVEYLERNHLPAANQPDFYYWYYGTQVFHHAGGQSWDSWNLRMREILVDKQITRGNQAGSWNPEGPHSSTGGRIYVTSLAVCTLEVYYRHTPIFRQLELE